MKSFGLAPGPGLAEDAEQRDLEGRNEVWAGSEKKDARNLMDLAQSAG
jgi:hypothetical protein